MQITDEVFIFRALQHEDRSSVTCGTKVIKKLMKIHTGKTDVKAFKGVKVKYT